MDNINSNKGIFEKFLSNNILIENTIVIFMNEFLTSLTCVETKRTIIFKNLANIDKKY